MNINPAYGRMFFCHEKESEKMNYRYPENPICYGCPYTFPSQIASCTMGGNPKTCVWQSYQKICEVDTSIREDKPIQQPQPQAQEKIQNCIEMLINVGEQKFGKKYADNLRRNRIEK